MKLPYARQSINHVDIRAVTKALSRPVITRGPIVERFERAIAEYVGARYAVACSSGTAALCLAFSALDRESIVTTTNTCAATVMAALSADLEAHLVDIEPDTWQSLDVTVPVHLMGHPSVLSLIFDWQVEDAAHALGAKFDDGFMVGSCKNSKATCFSFHPSKTITTGEGGMVTTNDQGMWEDMKALKDYGRYKPNSHESFGLNYHMTEFQAVLGLSQLARINEFLDKRRELATRYFAKLDGFPITLPLWHDGSSWHLFLVRIPQEKRKEVGKAFEKAGIQNQVLYRCLHTMPFWGGKEGQFPEAEAYEKECIALPLYPDLTSEDQDYVANVLEGALEEKTTVSGA